MMIGGVFQHNTGNGAVNHGTVYRRHTEFSFAPQIDASRVYRLLGGYCLDRGTDIVDLKGRFCVASAVPCHLPFAER